MVRTGIIPAAGKAIRFGRIPKELLPLPDGRALIDHAIDRLAFCDRVVVVTDSRKAPFHNAIVGGRVTLVYQQGSEMLGAWLTACGLYRADRYYMTMPDTYIKQDAFADCQHDEDFALGVFETYEPERFGVIDGGLVQDKHKAAATPATAWGALVWSDDVYRLWLDKQVWDYTVAINEAVKCAGLHTWPIGEYHDCADAYRYGQLWDRLRGRLA